MKLLPLVKLVTLLVTLCPAAMAQHPALESSYLRIGVVYNSTTTGQLHFQAIQDALRDHAIGKRAEIVEIPYTELGQTQAPGTETALKNHDDANKLRIAIVLIPYVNELQGEERLLAVLKNRQVDLVLGPTDSGVYVRVVEQKEKVGENIVPVISSLVVAGEPNEADGWFFRTNADIARRTGAIYDYLNKRWVNSIAVMYAESEFGRRAERAFRRELTGIQADNYLPLPYQGDDFRPALRRILDKRPAAVGLFGPAEDMVTIFRDLRSMNAASTLYRPISFAVIDIRRRTPGLDDFYFVSVMRPEESSNNGPEENEYGDVYGLSYDTTTLVLNEIKNAGLDRPFEKRGFRDRFANVLSGAVGTPGPKTGMRFSNMANSGELHVYRVDGDKVVVESEDVVGMFEKLRWKQQLMVDRFGMLPLAVLATIFLTVFGASVNDLYRWYGGSFKQLLLGPPHKYSYGRRLISKHFLALVLIQFSIAVLLYAFLSETGRIRYDSILNAFVIALAPSPLLRASFANIGGTNIGFADQYDRILKYLTKRLLAVKYGDKIEDAKLVLAYYNSHSFLKRTVTDIYLAIPNKEEGARLRAEMEVEQEQYTEQIDRRKALAQRLVEMRTWEELHRLRAVPESMKDLSNIQSPEAVITDCVYHCFGDKNREDILETVVQDQLKRASDPVIAHYKTKIRETENGTDTLRDKVFVKLQFLVMTFGFLKKRLIEEGLHPREDKEASTAEKSEDN
ncbi:MAG: ABC transporter substrate-binding protein [Gammaproteobacteria bacterium]|nr:ABC transporter substrate-binding protein [Gammaproteobacteria bacterium]MDJ0870947.1 ABC transporter substrate-binding protein [Gammaproteobacteria bacterium]